LTDGPDGRPFCTSLRMALLLLLVASFLLGSVPFAQMLLRGRGVDLRLVGSGNVGAANVLRVSTPRTAGVVLALDASKGGLVVWLVGVMTGDPALAVWAGLAAIVGHIFPPWLGFRGGKGVATSGGVFLVLVPPAVAGAAAIFVLTVWLTRFVSLGSLSAVLSLPPLVALCGASSEIIAGASAAALLVGLRHRANIRRLLAGTERRLGQRAPVS
jgi:acyl phosphate:glycerol-3-phosphate acyltransferase